MDDQEIERTTAAFKRLLQRHRDCQFGKVETTIHKGHIKDMTLHREESGIRNGEVVGLKLAGEGD